MFRNFGGADGIRTHDLLDAIEARSQLRHGPTELQLNHVSTGHSASSTDGGTAHARNSICTGLLVHVKSTKRSESVAFSRYSDCPSAVAGPPEHAC
jgi:hypothetical protein